ncbi:MAG: MBL fold metallo-hydrolase [Gammaproteobacteria bacterium]|nr:MBL fold metallo-hydrolase [Gammaproteobacteria bacterium]NNM20156.1 MBL fold metallo-hydrolase [Gammaproteobacteria bacterium]
MKLPVFLVCAALLLSGCATVRDTADNEQVTNRGADKDRWWSALPRPAWQQFARVEQSQDWFEVYRVADGVLAIYEPGQFEEVISYLITGTQRALLFDTGLGFADMRRLVAELTNLEVVVLNSHTHYDHIGGNHAFATVFGVDTGYTRSRANGLDHDEVSFAVGPGWIWKPLPPGFDAASYAIASYQIDRFVRDGQRIDLGGRVLEVLLTPGHAPDALCLLDRANRLLFTGDTFYLAPLYTHLEGSDFTQYANTARRLAGLAGEVELLMPGHNEPALSAHYLQLLERAFNDIAAGRPDYTETDGHRQYDFGGFSIITR